MDSTISTPKPLSNRSSSYPSNLPPYVSEPAATRPVSLPSRPPELKPILVPDAGSAQKLGATVTADARVYAPGVRQHDVVAVRVSGGISNGDATVGRTFLLGGSTPATSLVSFSSRASSLLRGFPDATFAGSRVALVNAEYRFPVYRLERGIGTWPIFFHTIHGAVFGDAGETWTTTFRTGSIKTSAGVEASCDIVAAYFARLTFALGAALGRDRAGVVKDNAVAYFRIGKAF